jgi:hypothetical protein
MRRPQTARVERHTLHLWLDGVRAARKWSTPKQKAGRKGHGRDKAKAVLKVRLDDLGVSDEDYHDGCQAYAEAFLHEWLTNNEYDDCSNTTAYEWARDTIAECKSEM